MNANPLAPDTDALVRDLQQLLEGDDELRGQVVWSLRRAHDRAARDLDGDLFQALDWPRDLGEYAAYLRSFLRWIPQQSDAPAWKTSAPEHRYAKEVSDRLAHFFWLVDQAGDDESVAAESSRPFSAWLTRFAREWGAFLDTPESFDQDVLNSFLRDAPEYTIEESMVEGRPNAPSGWMTFNQFFARELNAGLRPVSGRGDNTVVTSPADCIFQQSFDIGARSGIPATTIKGTHQYGDVTQLLEGSRYADTFAGGTFVHYMLPPSSYHRFHVPVSGHVEESFVVPGRVYMQVDLEDHQLRSKDAARSGYEFSQVRGVLTLDTSGSPDGDLGIVAVVPVGMSHVASVTLTTVPGTGVAKGQEFGFFQFGGSDIIVLLQPGIEVDLDRSEGLRKVGSSIARAVRAR